MGSVGVSIGTVWGQWGIIMGTSVGPQWDSVGIMCGQHGDSWGLGTVIGQHEVITGTVWGQWGDIGPSCGDSTRTVWGAV